MRKKSKNEMWKKTSAIAASIMIIMMSFSISMSMNSETVKAADSQTGCCIKTKSGQSCVNEATPDICEAGSFITTTTGDCSGKDSRLDQCKPGVCVPLNKSQACMSNIEKTPCETNYAAKWFPGDISSIAQCQKGCCIIAGGVKAEVVQQGQCEEMAKDMGYSVNEMKFDTSITKQIDCAKAAPNDLSCCVLSGGSCKYTTRDSCSSESGNFMEGGGMAGVLCSSVNSCASSGHAKSACGTLPGTEMDVYWFDSQGNQEDIVVKDGVKGCNYPNNICSKKNETAAECISTTCKIEGAPYGQMISIDKTHFVKTYPIGTSLLMGTSECYNFYTYVGDDRMLEKSTGLQNQILHCNQGRIEIDPLGPDRLKLCVNTTKGSLHGNIIEPDMSKCGTCGQRDSKGVWDSAGDLFGPFPPFGKLINDALGNYCTKDICEGGAYGDCVYMEDVNNGLKNAFIITRIGTTPIGSCNPKYPAGTNKYVPPKTAGASGTIDTTASKTECAKCGAGGDAMWNVCDKKECVSLGDCSFKPDNPFEGSIRWAFIMAGASLTNRFLWIPVECTIYGTYRAIASSGVDWTGYGNCYAARTVEYGHWLPSTAKWIWNLENIADLGTIVGIAAVPAFMLWSMLK